MQRIDDATAATSLPAPEAAGTPGFFTEGNPTSGTPATNVRGSWLNMVQEELMAVVVAGGLTPSKTTYNQVLSAIRRIGQNTLLLADTGATNAYAAVNPTPLVASTWVDGVVQTLRIGHSNTGASTYSPDGLTALPIYGLGLQPLQGNELIAGSIATLMRATVSGVNGGNPIAVLLNCLGGGRQVAPATQSQHAVQLGQVGHGQCYFQLASSTQCVLVPQGGNNMLVNAVPYTIPSAGLSLSNSGLSANTFYYIYLTVSNGVGTLSASTTGHVRGSNGVEVMNGNPAATLVGAVLMNGSGVFQASNNFYGVLSWFNRKQISLQPVSTAGTATSNAPAEINSNNRCTFISWLNESVMCSVTGFASPSVAQAACVLSIGFNSTTSSSGGPSQANAPFASAAVGLAVAFTPFIASENNAQYITPLGQVSTGSCPFNITNSVTIRG